MVERKEIEDVIANVFPQSLYEGDPCKSPDYLAAAAERGVFQPLVLKEAQIAASFDIVARYLAQRAFTGDFLSTALGVKPGDMILMPQLDYHLDVFMRPGPHHALLVQDYAMALELIRWIGAQANLLQLSDKDRKILCRYEAASERLAAQLKPVTEKVVHSLTQEGFTVIPAPAIFYDVTPALLSPFDRDLAETYNVNFMNAITGYSQKTGRYYYIVGGATVGDRLGFVLMDAYREFMQGYQPDLDLFFVGRDPKHPGQFSESMAWQNKVGAQAGVHCFSVEGATKSFISS